MWRKTRDVVLSPANPYYFSGTAASGIGSPHTLPGRVWPIALAVEAFDASDPTTFSRPWFSWADSMFCELALTVAAEAAAVGPPRSSARPAPAVGLVIVTRPGIQATMNL
ncbi:hypothetical protein GCM10023198_11510 [Promicromonospora umidemergens]|uniref:Uncharacterized protein n=1 Tax=Promicromonospora umidemergens TaxID=629679 RepID=A0ABP8WQ59_9MICO